MALGKSSLAVRFVGGHFVESYYPTIENTFSATIKVGNSSYAVEIVDSTGQVSLVVQSCWMCREKQRSREPAS